MGRRFTDGNSIDVLENGVQIFPAMLEAVASARHRVDFVTYVYWTGEIARRFAEALAERAKAGVRVRVLLDAFGCKKMEDRLVEGMKTAGVDVRWFRPVATWRLWRSDKRTHRKLLVCDDKVAFTGGVGIAEEWEGDARNPGEWRDTHVAVRGPAVTELRAAFLDNWNEAGDWHFESRASSPEDQASDTAVQVLRSSTTIGWTDAAAMLRTLISLSEKKLRIVTAYFNPDVKLAQLIAAAAQRGVDVQILVPGQYCDSRLSQLAGHRHIEPLLQSGVQMWHYERTMLHAKLVTVDGKIACIGSVNMNHRSVGKDEECCVIALSEDLAAQLDESFARDKASAEPYTLSEWQRRGSLLRLKERCARMLVEQL
jgi:cardiolipin synthase